MNNEKVTSLTQEKSDDKLRIDFHWAKTTATELAPALQFIFITNS